MGKNKIPETGIYDARQLGTGRMLLLGFQHMFAMFGATVLVPTLTGLSVSATLLFAGLGTLLFHLITGGKVPAFLGSSFAFLSGYAAVKAMPQFADGTMNWIPYAGVGVAVAGLIYVVVAGLFKIFGAQKVMRFFPPIVTGPIIICIGMILAKDAKRAQEALPYLSESLLIHEAALVRTVMGYLNLFLNSRDYAQAQALLAWALPIFTAMPRPECTSFMDKINSVFYLFQAHVLLKIGQPEEARTSAEEAHRLAVRFDAAPSYAAATICFAMPGEDSTVNDDLGETAAQATQNALKQMEDPQTTALWQEMCDAR